MSVTLNSETQQIIEDCMKETGIETADDLVRLALRTLEGTRGVDFEDLDPEVQASIGRAEAQYERGEGRPWEEVREELRKRFVK